MDPGASPLVALFEAGSSLSPDSAGAGHYLKGWCLSSMRRPRIWRRASFPDVCRRTCNPTAAC